MKPLRWLRRQFIGPYKPLVRPAFPINSELEARAAAVRLRERLGDPKPLILENPDTWVKPLDYDEAPPPV